jgi:hypothetical protein
MAFIMRVSSNNKRVALLILLLCQAPGAAYPKNTGVSVKNAETILLGNVYLLSADIDYQLSDKATEALKNGVALAWRYRFKVTERVNFAWHKTILEKNFRYRIQYHALTNTYRVRNESSGAIESFSTLPAALDLMSTLRDYPLIEQAIISRPAETRAAMKISFEQDALPLPLRPFAYINPQWYLSSDWYEWSLKK